MLDAMDMKILALLQRDATMPVADIGREIGLSTTPCWRRIQRLEAEGVIRRRVAVLDPVKVNAAVNVFVSIKTDQHSHEWLAAFHSAVEDLPQVVEVYRTSGAAGYPRRGGAPRNAGHGAFYQELIGRITIAKVSSAFAMEQIKCTTELPLEFAVRRARKGRESQAEEEGGG